MRYEKFVIIFQRRYPELYIKINPLLDLDDELQIVFPEIDKMVKSILEHDNMYNSLVLHPYGIIQIYILEWLRDNPTKLRGYCYNNG